MGRPRPLRAARTLAALPLRAVIASERLLGLSVPKRRIGAAPGSLPEVPEAERTPAAVDLFHFGPDSHREARELPLPELLALAAEPGVAWINVIGTCDPEAIRALGEALALHPLVQEDLVHPHQRPKVEDYPSPDGGTAHLFVVARMLSLGPEGELVSEQVGFVIGAAFLLTVQERPGDVFEPVRERLRQPAARIRQRGPDYLAYALLDVIVDHYFAVLEVLGEEIDRLETALIDEPRREHQERIRQLRRSALAVRRAVWPLRDVLNALLRDDSGRIDDATRLYLRDAYDHTIQVTELLESFRDVLASLSDLYLSSLSHRLNEVMKVLTVIGTIFIPLSFLVGIYGMNFEYMPELAWRYGYFAILGVSAVLIVGSLGFFRWKGWI